MSVAVIIAGSTDKICWPVFTEIGAVFSTMHPAVFAGKIIFSVWEQVTRTLKIFSSLDNYIIHNIM